MARAVGAGTVFEIGRDVGWADVGVVGLRTVPHWLATAKAPSAPRTHCSLPPAPGPPATLQRPGPVPSTEALDVGVWVAQRACRCVGACGSVGENVHPPTRERPATDPRRTSTHWRPANVGPGNAATDPRTSTHRHAITSSQRHATVHPPTHVRPPTDLQTPTHRHTNIHPPTRDRRPTDPRTFTHPPINPFA